MTSTTRSGNFAALALLLMLGLALERCVDPPPRERPREQWSDEETGAYGDSQRALQSLTDCVLNYTRNARNHGTARDVIVPAGFSACARIRAEYEEYTLSWATYHITDAMPHPRRHKAEIELRVSALERETIDGALAAIRSQAELILPGGN